MGIECWLSDWAESPLQPQIASMENTCDLGLIRDKGCNLTVSVLFCPQNFQEQNENFYSHLLGGSEVLHSAKRKRNEFLLMFH